VRATRSTRWKPRADSCSCPDACRSSATPASSGIATSSSSRPEQSALVRTPLAPSAVAQHQVGGGHGRHLNLQVDAVEQRARDARLVVVGAARAALARIHGGDQLDARGVGDAVVGARDHGRARLQRLAQGVEHVGQELRPYAANTPNGIWLICRPSASVRG
jgi:hypothetical protein